MDSHYLILAVYKTKEYPLGDMSQWDDYHLADQVAATHVAERGVPRQRWSHVYNMYEMT